MVKVENIFSIVIRDVVQDSRHKEFFDALFNKKMSKNKWKEVKGKAKKKNTLVSGNEKWRAAANYFF